MTRAAACRLIPVPMNTPSNERGRALREAVEISKARTSSAAYDMTGEPVTQLLDTRPANGNHKTEIHSAQRAPPSL